MSESKLPKSVLDAVTFLAAASYDAGKHGALESSSVRDASEELGFAIATELARLEKAKDDAEERLAQLETRCFDFRPTHSSVFDEVRELRAELGECESVLQRERAARADHARRTVEILKGKQS